MKLPAIRFLHVAMTVGLLAPACGGGDGTGNGNGSELGDGGGDARGAGNDGPGGGGGAAGTGSGMSGGMTGGTAGGGAGAGSGGAGSPGNGPVMGVGCVRMCADRSALRQDGTIVWKNGDTKVALLTDVEGKPFKAEEARDMAGGTANPGGEPATCVVKKDGTVWCWGDNGEGAIGAGSIEELVPVPRQVVTADRLPLTGVQRISATFDGQSFCAVADEGRLYCWGTYVGDRIGFNFLYASNVATPVFAGPGAGPFTGATAVALAHAVGQQQRCLLRADGSVLCWGLGSPFPEVKPVLNKATHLACGGSNVCCARMDDGTVWCWAGVLAAQKMVLPDGQPLSNVTNLVPAVNRTGIHAVRTDGSLALIGGPGSPAMPATGPAPALVGAQCQVDSKGQLFARGGYFTPSCLSTAAELPSNDGSCGTTDQACCAGPSCGAAASCFEGRCACGRQGTPCCGGASACGSGLQCSRNARCSCVRSCSGQYVLRHDGAIVWDGNNYARSQDGQIWRAEGALDIAGSRTKGLYDGTACVVRADGTAWCWGQNDQGELGAGVEEGASAFPRQVIKADQTPLTAVQKLATDTHGDTFCAVAEGGKLFCWGKGSSYFLGQPQGAYITRTATEVRGQSGATFDGIAQVALTITPTGAALKSDGTVWSWGGGPEPTMVPIPGPASGVACGLTSCCALAAGDGSLWCFSGYQAASAAPIPVVQIKYNPSQPLTGAVAIAPGFDTDIHLLFPDQAMVSIDPTNRTAAPVVGRAMHRLANSDRRLTSPQILGQHCLVTAEGHHLWGRNDWLPFCE